MRGWTESINVVALNLRNLKSRGSVALGAVLGFAAVVAVLVAALSISAGFNAALGATGSNDVVIVLSGKAKQESASLISADDVNALASAPGVMHDAKGPVAAPELLGSLNVKYRADGKDASIALRAVGANARRLRPQVHLIKGRWFKPGLNEVVVGSAAAARFQHLQIDDTVEHDKKQWKVVGIFDAGQSIYGTEAWTDVHALQDAAGIGNMYTADFIRLTSPAAFAAFKQAVTHDPRLNVNVERETDYYAAQAKDLSKFIAIVGAIIAGVMGIGAIFGALNTMYTAVSARGREIATLRALGFGRLPVLLSVVAEALALGFAGGVLGGFIAWLLFNGYQASTMNSVSNNQVAFAFAVTPTAIGLGVAFALVLGLIGGLAPAVRAAGLPVAVALRDT